MNVCTDEDLAFLSIPIFFLVASSKVLSARSSAGRGTVRSLEGKRNLALLDLCLHVCVVWRNSSEIGACCCALHLLIVDVCFREGSCRSAWFKLRSFLEWLNGTSKGTGAHLIKLALF